MNFEEQRSFLQQILNEILRGFEILKFEAVLGLSRDDAHGLEERVRKVVSLSELSARDKRFLRDATALTLRELENGIHEFQTRTGFEVTDANQTIKFLSKGLSGE